MSASKENPINIIGGRRVSFMA